MKVALWRKICAVLAFWGLVLFGGSLVLLWNALSPAYSRYQQGDLGYILLVIAAKPIGVSLAGSACNAIVDGECPILRLVNNLIAVILIAAMTLNAIAWGDAWGEILSLLLSAIVAGYLTFTSLQDLAKHMRENVEGTEQSQTKA